MMSWGSYLAELGAWLDRAESTYAPSPPPPVPASEELGPLPERLRPAAAGLLDRVLVAEQTLSRRRLEVADRLTALPEDPLQRQPLQHHWA